MLGSLTQLNRAQLNRAPDSDMARTFFLVGLVGGRIVVGDSAEKGRWLVVALLLLLAIGARAVAGCCCCC